MNKNKSDCPNCTNKSYYNYLFMPWTYENGHKVPIRQLMLESPKMENLEDLNETVWRPKI